MAEICVHPTQRGRGHVHQLLEAAHQALRERGAFFAVLFGDSKIYRSSGYRPISATIARLDPTTQRVEVAPHPSALVRALADRPWPDGPVDLRGPLF
jgi:predicted acetyltransferase